MDLQEGFECDRTFALAEAAYDVLDSTPHLAGEVLLDDRLRLTIGNRVNDAKVAGYPYVMCLGKKVRVTHLLRIPSCIPSVHCPMPMLLRYSHSLVQAIALCRASPLVSRQSTVLCRCFYATAIA